jgi:hypothetical protein
MDELFFLPRTTIVMLCAYWLMGDALSSQIAVIEPFKYKFERILQAFPPATGVGVRLGDTK